MIITRTPFRVSFFGGGTDYPAWYREHGGAVLATTINKYCYIHCRFLPPFFEHRSRIVWSRIELVQETSDIQHPAVREALAFLGITEGVELHHVGDLPARTGLGSSSSFSVGVLNALHALRGDLVDRMQLAREAIHLEQERLHETVGSQDQLLAAFGGFNRIDLSGEDNFRVSPVVVGRARLDDLERHLMLFFTGISRTASVIAQQQLDAMPHRKRELRAMYQMVDEAMGLLHGGGDLAEFGELLDESWRLKRALAENVSTGYIDDIYDTARKAGAIGGKLLGAGGGGFLLLFVRPEDQARVRAALGRFLCVPFHFESSGSHIAFYEQDEVWPA
jgi:D-glycero-alpha-D-manno-heptose-7-phosphate kinase